MEELFVNGKGITVKELMTVLAKMDPETHLVKNYVAMITDETRPPESKNWIYHDCFEQPRLVAAITLRLREVESKHLQPFLERIAFGPWT